MADPEPDDVAELVVIHARSTAHEYDREPELRAVLEGALLQRAQVAAPDLEVGPLLEPVDLQLDRRAELSEGLDEPPIPGQADAVRVQRHVPHTHRHRQLDEIDDPRVDRGLSTRLASSRTL